MGAVREVRAGIRKLLEDKMKKYLLTILLFILAVLSATGIVYASDISNALWHGTIRATNNGTANSSVSVAVSINNTALIANNFANSTLTDVVIRKNGTDVPFMPGYGSNPWLFFVSDIGANQNVDYDFYTGNVSGASPAIMVQYMTITDAATMEGSDNFTAVYDGFIDTSISDYIINKPSALSVNVTATGNISAYLPAYASDTLRYSSDAEVSTASGTYTVVKTITLTQAVNAARIKFDIKSQAGVIAYGKIYKNGVAIGTEQSTTGTSFATKSEDITIAAGIGDSIQLYGKNDDGIHEVYYRNFRIYYDGGQYTNSAIVSSGEHTVTTTLDSPFLSLGIDATSDPITPVTENLTLNAPLWQDDCSSSPFTTIDSTEYTGTVTNAVWSENNGYAFDGTGDYITFSDISRFEGTDHLSIETWIKVNVFALSRGIVTKRVGAQSSWGLILGAVGNTFGFKVYTSATNLQVNSTTSRSTGTWYHVVGVYNGTDLRIYVNGVLDSTPASLSGGINDSTADVMFGRYYDTNTDINATIGDVRIYDKALTATEILQNYNATKSKYTSGDIYTVSTLLTVPDNSNNIVIGSDATPYINSYAFYQGGVQTCGIAWEYAATFTDSTGNGNDATPTFRTTSTDADISADLLDLLPTSESQVSTFSLSSTYEILSGTPTTPTNLYGGEDFTTKIPGQAANEILTAANVPKTAWWYPFLFLGICVIGMLVYGATTMFRGQRQLVEGQVDGSLLVMFVVMEVLLYLLGQMNVIPEWCYYIFPIGGIAIILSRKHLSWG